MVDIKRVFYFVCMAVLLLAASGCGGSDNAPDMIGSYPSGASTSGAYSSDGDSDIPEMIGSYPDASVVVYHCMLDLEVKSVSEAFEEAKSLAHDAGGYVTAAQTWYEDRDERATVVIAVPVFNYELLYEDILRLGVLKGETVNGELESPGSYGRDRTVMSTITVHLSERSTIDLPEIPDWHAVNTFENAFGVAAGLFRFLLDAAIWVLVVVGPFVLLGWAGRKLWLRLRKPQVEEERRSIKDLDKEN